MKKETGKQSVSPFNLKMSIFATVTLALVTAIGSLFVHQQDADTRELLKDINGDGVIDMSDIQENVDSQILSNDFNKDGVIDMKDIQKAVEILEGKTPIDIEDQQSLNGRDISSALSEMIDQVKTNKNLTLSAEDQKLIQRIEDFLNKEQPTSAQPTSAQSTSVRAPLRNPENLMQPKNPLVLPDSARPKTVTNQKYQL